MSTFNNIFEGACKDLDFEQKCEHSETICEAVFRTNKQTCNSHCESLGLICEDAWNDKKSGSCVKDTDAASGCYIPYQMQICRCKTGKSIIGTIGTVAKFTIIIGL